MPDARFAPSGPVRVGYVVKRYPRFSETFVVNEILSHEERGREIAIFALRPVEESHFQDILARVRAPVVRIPDRLRGVDEMWAGLVAAGQELPGFWETLARFPEATGRDVMQAGRLAQEVSRRGIGHLHAHFGTVAATVTRIAAALAGVPWSVTLHAKDIYCAYEENQNLDLKMRDADAVVTVSDFNLDHLAARFPAARGRTLRIYNGIDLAAFPWAPPRPEAREILAVGRLVEKKGFHILIEAIRILKAEGRAPSCRIIGSGEEEADLRAQIASAGLEAEMRLEGPRPQAEVKAAMREAALLACPCIVGEDGNRDGLPTVLLEAMALGLPCVGTDVTGIPELVQDGRTGLIVPEGEAEPLARALTRLLDDADLRARLSRAGRALMEREFDIRRNVPALGAIFDRLAAPGERGAA